MPGPLTLHVGTYAESGGPGLVPLVLEADGRVTIGEPYAAAANASFAARSARRDLDYLVDEAAGMVGVHRREGSGWRELARFPSGGKGPCYVTLDAEEGRLAIANYESGHAALFELGPDGVPQGPPSLFRSPGSGPVAERQEGPHAHCVRFAAGGEALYLVDLGADRVLRVDLGPEGFAEPGVAYRAPAGSGPRHLLFHPARPLAVLVSELASTLTLLELGGDGSLRPLQIVSTLPPGFSGENLAGHLEFGDAGARLYVSNRGHDSIAVFGLDTPSGAGGWIELLQHVPSGGQHPRHFERINGPTLPNGGLVVAHERDGRLCILPLTEEGELEPPGPGLRVPGACFVLASGVLRGG